MLMLQYIPENNNPTKYAEAPKCGEFLLPISSISHSLSSSLSLAPSRNIFYHNLYRGEIDGSEPATVSAGYPVIYNITNKCQEFVLGTKTKADHSFWVEEGYNLHYKYLNPQDVAVIIEIHLLNMTLLHRAVFAGICFPRCVPCRE